MNWRKCLVKHGSRQHSRSLVRRKGDEALNCSDLLRTPNHVPKANLHQPKQVIKCWKSKVQKTQKGNNKKVKTVTSFKIMNGRFV